jgi:hypothetical protein
MNASNLQKNIDLIPAEVLGEAFLNAGKDLGLTQADLGVIIGRDRTIVSRGRIDPDSKEGELALLFIRCYRSLFVLIGGDLEQMKLWLNSTNRDLLGAPKDLLKSIVGLIQVVEYLDAMRAKV